MSKNKMSNGRQRWVVETVNLLKPLVVAGEPISRRQAIKAVHPRTDWERRELEKLRTKANRVVRRENCDPLIYSFFGMSLEHPEAANHKAFFTDGLAAIKADYVVPENLKITGLQEYPDYVYHAVGYANAGDTWIIRSPYNDLMQFMFIEKDDMYVLSDPRAFGEHTTTGERFDRSHISLARINIIWPDTKSSVPDNWEAVDQLPIVWFTEEQALKGDFDPNAAIYFYTDGQGVIHTSVKDQWLEVKAIPDNLLSSSDSLLRVVGCPVNVIGHITFWCDLPTDPTQGDAYFKTQQLFGANPSRLIEANGVVWNGKVWINIDQPHNVVDIPNDVQLKRSLKTIADSRKAKLANDLKVSLNDNRPISWTNVAAGKLSWWKRFTGFLGL